MRRDPVAVTLAAAAAAAALAVFAGGGFDPVPRALFVPAAGIALICAAAADREAALRSLASPVPLVLLALASLAALSAAWTIAAPADALRWGAVIAAYAALASASAVVASRPGGVRRLAAVLCAVAAVAALLGLIAVALRVDPLALRLGRVWRPAGPFEYPPALALLQVSALPGLMAAMTLGRGALPYAASVAAAMAGAVLGLADSRVELVLAALAVGAAVAGLWTRPEARRRGPAAAALMALAALAAHLALGGAARGDELGGDGGRLGVLLVLLAAAPPLWWALRAAADGGGREARRMAVPALAAAAGAAAILVAASAFEEPLRGRGSEPVSGVAHGRERLWEAAVSAGAERPVQGAGSEAFYVASIEDQEGPRSLYAHSLPLELWVELGIAGALLAIALYAASVRELWRARRTDVVWLLGPAAAAFLAANLVDWPWHLAGAGAVWAVAIGGVVGAAGAGRGGSVVAGS
jgi:hypothetical protein